MKKMKRMLSMLLLVSMILSMLIPGVSAAEPEKALTNLALGKTVTTDWSGEVACGLDMITDGDTYAKDENTCIMRGSDLEHMYVTIDLEKTYDIFNLNFFGYIGGADGVDAPQNTIFMVSEDEEFTAEDIVYNSDKDNTWGFGTGTDDNVQALREGYAIELERPVAGRYVRYYQNDTIWDGGPHINWLAVCEIEVYGEEHVPAEPMNVAQGKPVSTDWSGSVACGLDMITDGDTYAKDENTCIMRGSDFEHMYVTIDLGSAYDIFELKYYGYIGGAGGVDAPQNTIFMLSEDAEFTAEDIVYNSDKDNTWGFGAGSDENVKALREGYSITLDTPVKARYVRYYQNDTIWDGGPHIQWLAACEIEAYAIPNDADFCKVTFDYNCEGMDNVVREVLGGRSVKKPVDPVRENYDFQGWLLDGKPYDFATPVTGDITLTASWKEIVFHTVTFRQNNGQEDLTVSVKDGMLPELPANPVKDGFNFGGWKVEGVPFNPTEPVTADLTAEAAWVTAQEEGSVRIAAGLADYYLNTKGQITNIISRLNGIDYIPSTDKTPYGSLISLIADGAHHVPTAMRYADETLTFEFATINTTVDVALENKDSYTTFTVTDVTAPASVYVETLFWGPIKNTIEEVVGGSLGVAYDWEFGLGIHMLNDKTIGGWPENWSKLTYRPGFYHQDNSNLSGMPWYNNAAVKAPDKDTIYDDPKIPKPGETGAAKGWGGSFLQAHTFNYVKPVNRLSNAQVYWDHYDMDELDFNNTPCVVFEEVPALVNSAIPGDAYVEGSSIALFGCKARNILNTVENVELGENLPHPTTDGEWNKKAHSVKGSESSGSVSTGSVDAVSKAAADSGIRYVYGIYGAVGPFVHNGSFRFDGRWGGSDYAAQTQMCDVAGKYGVGLGVHTMTNYMGNRGDGDNLYIFDYGAHPDIAYAATTVLTRPADADATTLYVADGTNLGVIHSPEHKWLRIGSEIVTYREAVQVSPEEWKVNGCTRGSYGTAAYQSSYEAGTSVARLMPTAYNGVSGGINVSLDIAKRQAQAINNSGIRNTSCDGMEQTWMSGYYQLAMNQYATALWENLDESNKDGFCFVNSCLCANQWDILSYERWNGPVADHMPNFKFDRPSDEPIPLSDPRPYLMQRNLLSQIYSVNFSSSFQINRELSAIAALDAGFNCGYLNGLSAADRASIKAWVDAITCNAFTQQQKQDFFNAYVNERSNSWTLATVTEHEAWTLQKVDQSGNAIGEAVTVKASGKLDIADVKGGNVATTLSMKNVTGVNPDHLNKLKAGFQGTVDFLAQPGDIVIVSPQADMGYKCVGVTVTDMNGDQVALTARDDTYGNYEFTMPQGDVTITPSFEKDEAFRFVTVTDANKAVTGNGTVTVKQPENGTISVNGTTVTAVPAEGYQLLQITAESDADNVVYVDDGLTYNADEQCYVDENGENISVLTMPETGNVTVSAMFVPEYHVESQLDVDLTTAVEGDLVVVDVNAPVGQKYVPGTLLVLDKNGNGVPTHVVYDEGKYNKYEFSMPASDVTITAEFTVTADHIVKTKCDNKGTVTISTETAKLGETVEFTVTAYEGNVVSSVYVLDDSGNQPVKITADDVFKRNSNRINGQKTEVTGSFVMPDGNMTVFAYFEGETEIEEPLPELEHGLDVAALSGSTELSDGTGAAANAHDHDMKTAWKTNTVQGVSWDDDRTLTVTLKDVSDVTSVKFVPYQALDDEALMVVCRLFDENGDLITQAGNNTTELPVGEIAEFTFEGAKNVASVQLFIANATNAACAHLGISEVEIYGTAAVTVDKTALEALYNANVNKENENYTEESWTAFQAALTEAKTVLDNETATQEEVDTAKSALEAAIAGLVFNAGEITDAEKSILKDLLDEVSKLDESKYTEESWNVLTKAVEAAKALIENDEATVEQIKAAETELRAAIDGLTEKPVVKEEVVWVYAVVDGDKENAKRIYSGRAPHGANVVEWLNENVQVEDREGYAMDKWYMWDWYGHKFDEKRTVNGWTNVYVTFTQMEKIFVKGVIDGDKANAQILWSGYALKGTNLVEFLNENADLKLPEGCVWNGKWMNWDWYGHKFSEKTTVNGWTNVYVDLEQREAVTVVVKAVLDGDKAAAKTLFSGKAPKGVKLVEWLNANVEFDVDEGYEWDGTWMNWDWYGHKFNNGTKTNGWTNVYVDFTKN